MSHLLLCSAVNLLIRLNKNVLHEKKMIDLIELKKPGIVIGTKENWVNYKEPMRGSSPFLLERHRCVHAVRLFCILLFAVHGHHDKGPFAVHGHHDKGQGTGAWDDITGVVKRGLKRGRLDDFSENFIDIDMNARNQAVDEWMASRRENQSMYREQPIDAF